MALGNRSHAFSLLMRRSTACLLLTWGLVSGIQLYALEAPLGTAAACPDKPLNSLVQLEDQERKIREDTTVTREEKLRLLQDIWKKETSVTGGGHQVQVSGLKKTFKTSPVTNKIDQPVAGHEIWRIFPLLRSKPKVEKTELSMIAQSKAVISVLKQKMYVFTGVNQYRVYPVSTSKYGLGDDLGSYKTPLGLFVVKTKIGEGLKPGVVFKSREPTSEVVRPNAPDRDPIVTRIIWLQGLEKRNQHAYQRFIYIHGTPQEKDLGHPASFGCVRMASSDVIKVYEMLAENSRVAILEELDDSTLRKLHYVEARGSVNKVRTKA
jgi:lipoprotein-anchoring transpeptidase ErfK/SrfK